MMLSTRLYELREARRITQEELSAKLFASRQCVYNWESGTNTPSVEMLIQLADFFSVSTDYLLGLDDRKYISVSGLNEEQIAHVQQLVNDVEKNNQKHLE